MCRLLLVKSDQEFDIETHLSPFSRICRLSREFQGHGWGILYNSGINGDGLTVVRNLKPVWESPLGFFGKTDFMLVHARSAFRDEGIRIANNMPFFDGEYGFIFNGELRGVRLKSDGGIGAEKIFNLIRRLNRGNMTDAFTRSIEIIKKRTGYIRAMNIIMSDGRQIYISSLFNREPDYFTLFSKSEKNRLIICSETYGGDTNWIPIDNHTVKVIG